jgi:membrane protease YdiL (CAAX protease family)
MKQTTPSTSLQTQSKKWHEIFRIFLGFIILYCAIWIIRVIMGVGPNLLLKWLGASANVRAYIGSTLNYGVGIVSYILLPAVALRKVLNIDPWRILFPLQKTWLKDLLFGFLLVTAVLLAFFIVEVKAGWLTVDGWNWHILPADAFLRTLWVGLLVNIGVAIGEETIFRGYLLTGLKSALGKWSSVILMMVIFGSFHLPAYSASGGIHSWTLVLAILLATLFGGLFGLVYLRTKSLWLPISLHFSWNFIENDVLNLTADSSNPNLIGAITRLHPPLTMNGLTPGNVIFVEGLAFAAITFGVWFWLKKAGRNHKHRST